MSDPETLVRAEHARWLLLVHQLPPKPGYPRVKVWRRLQALGAVAVRNAAYVLPAGEQAQEDFEWLLKEIGELGGEGMIWEARLVDGLSDEDVRGLFNAARGEDYDAVSKEARALTAALDAADAPMSRAEAKAKVGRLRTEVARIAAIDFFGADGREQVEGLLSGLEARTQEDEAMEEDRQERPSGPAAMDALKGQVWVTRRGVYVDRIASAWLIRRFIDPEAQFKFVPAKGYEPEPGEVRFDMYEGEFTHEGDRCTFEVLLSRAGLNDPALAAIGEIVHDIDLKDAKFSREEASGIARVMDGIAAANKDDQRRLERGAAVLDDLYEVFRRTRG
ncbi:chromate resistance protein [Siccirubricoccus sp. KC 17139]|uniref:Chromate resistance protein n=1 Tax=Siccirubricoccus soli TaxID=2899147 RepID=A0ABT1D3R0_9PROT|nr:chromate resistance protein ChrB domain-containing protein [Siccirubricoccus soli]MCO6415844.1 chromate resistance protein [Siccirubricoccus soli]MCP2681976.1 chromate resistance protein [Siccirubricoccus soli]